MGTLAYRKDIDGLRAFAVLPVVLHHANVAPFTGGFVGVDIFFVISGYLIASILLKEAEAGQLSILRFYERRARRILPALLAVLAACAIAGFLFLPPDPLRALGLSMQATTFFFANIWFFQRGEAYFSPEAKTDPLLHMWSLSVEEQFYIVFPLLVLLFVRRPRWVLVTLSVVLCLGSLALAETMVRSAPAYTFFIVFTRIWELGVGVLLALGLAGRPARGTMAEAVGMLGLALIVLPVFLYDDATVFPGLTATPPVIGAALLIWSGAVPTRVAAFLSLRPLVWFGLISYSLYLWHWPVIVAMRLRLGTLDLPLGAAIGAIGASILLGWLSWRFIERPFRRPATTGGFGRKAIFWQSGIALLGSFAVASVFVETGGLRALASEQDKRILAEIEADGGFGKCNYMRNPGEVCQLGLDGAPEVLVWGDSHARAASPGFDAWLRQIERSGALISVPGCPPLPGVVRGYDEDAALCAESQEFALDLVADTPSLKTLVLVARWPFIVRGDRPDGEEGGTAILRDLDDPASGDSIAGNEAIVRARLADLVADMRGQGVRVVLLGGVPEAVRPIAEQLLLHRSLGAPLPVGQPVAAVMDRQARSMAVLDDIAAIDAGVTHVPMVPYFCDVDPCRVIEDPQTTLYRDDDHISFHGARRFIPQAMAGVPDILPPR